MTKINFFDWLVTCVSPFLWKMSGSLQWDGTRSGVDEANHTTMAILMAVSLLLPFLFFQYFYQILNNLIFFCNLAA